MRQAMILFSVGALAATTMLVTQSAPRAAAARYVRIADATPRTTAEAAGVTRRGSTAPATSAAIEAADEPERYDVVVLSGDGRPLVDYAVRLHTRTLYVTPPVTTDRHGRARFRVPPHAANQKLWIDGDPLFVAAVTDYTTVVRLDGLPVTFVLYDVRTGATVRGGRVEILQNNANKDRYTPLHDLLHDLWLPRTPGFCQLRVHAPEGYSPPANVFVDARPSALADRIVVRIPLGPELRLRVRVVDEDRRPVQGATVRDAITDADGRAVLRRAPYAESLYVSAEKDGLFGGMWVAWNDRDHEQRIMLWPDKRDDRGDDSVPSVVEAKRPEPHQDWNCTVEAQVLRPDGTPVAGVRVELGAKGVAPVQRTGPRGWVCFRRVPPGEIVVTASDPGLVETTRRLTLHSGGAARLSLHTPAPRPATLLFRDCHGKPAPLVGVAVYADHVCRIEGGVQYCGLFADLEGRLPLLKRRRDHFRETTLITGNFEIVEVTDDGKDVLVVDLE